MKTTEKPLTNKGANYNRNPVVVRGNGEVVLAQEPDSGSEAGRIKKGFFEDKYDNRGSKQLDSEHLQSHLEGVNEGGDQDQELLEQQANDLLLAAGEGELVQDDYKNKTVWTSAGDLSEWNGGFVDDNDEYSPDDEVPNFSPEQVGAKGKRRIRDELAQAATAEYIPPQEREATDDLTILGRYITRNPR